jgi:hypothetical protein
VRVRSRTPGSFPVDVIVRSPDGVITLATARYKIRSLALSGVGLGISIAALAGPRDVVGTTSSQHEARQNGPPN